MPTAIGTLTSWEDGNWTALAHRNRQIAADYRRSLWQAPHPPVAPRTCEVVAMEWPGPRFGCCDDGLPPMNLDLSEDQLDWAENQRHS